MRSEVEKVPDESLKKPANDYYVPMPTVNIKMYTGIDMGLNPYWFWLNLSEWVKLTVCNLRLADSCRGQQLSKRT
jgi:hypothetical protein